MKRTGGLSGGFGEQAKEREALYPSPLAPSQVTGLEAGPGAQGRGTPSHGLFPHVQTPRECVWGEAERWPSRLADPALGSEQRFSSKWAGKGSTVFPPKEVPA